MILKLTSKPAGKVIYVNSNQLKAWDEAKDGVGTRLVFDDVHAYEVTETPDEVRKKLYKCLGLFCPSDN